MEAKSLQRWMELNGLSIRQAAKLLRVSPTTVQRWLKTGAPHAIGLAVSALDHGLGPFGG